ncbi:MAG: hypothetical protein EA383_09290 [Spirochaetaceae bacterium]|nr:MAG: hypothetical protein EA383_09290 [Spirochaetaceae bacterium]
MRPRTHRTNLYRLVSLCLLLAFVAPTASSYRLLYKEQLYRMYRRQFYNQPLNLNENIYWLEQTLRADFANPLNAIARIENERDWERYRYLFNMHVNLLLVDLYLAWANRYNRRNAYFFNYPWVDLNLESLEHAEDLFQYARIYWDEALVWSERAWQLRFVHLEEVQHWVDQNYRIETGDLDYNEIIDDHLERLYRVRQQFLDMGPETY